LDDDLISGEIVSESEGSEEEDDDEEGETTQENEETYNSYDIIPFITLQVIISEFISQDRNYGLWCLTPLSTIFQSYRSGQFYWKTEYLKKNN
jgi:hypothetical protein